MELEGENMEIKKRKRGRPKLSDMELRSRILSLTAIVNDITRKNESLSEENGGMKEQHLKEYTALWDKIDVLKKQNERLEAEAKPLRQALVNQTMIVKEMELQIKVWKEICLETLKKPPVYQWQGEVKVWTKKDGKTKSMVFTNS